MSAAELTGTVTSFDAFVGLGTICAADGTQMGLAPNRDIAFAAIRQHELEMEAQKQAQQAQAKMQELQAKIAAQEVTGQSGAGMVKITMTGGGEMRQVKIDPSLVVPSDVEVLEDLIVAACNDAKTKADEMQKKAMAEVMGGMGLPPGMKMPF